MSGKGRIALITSLAIITGLSLSFAISSLSSYTGDQQTIETLSYKSPLIWRTDGEGDYEGDYLLSELAPDGTYELVDAVETNSQIETLVATWEFKGKVILELSADNGQNYSMAVYGAPIAGFTSGILARIVSFQRYELPIQIQKAQAAHLGAQRFPDSGSENPLTSLTPQVRGYSIIR